MTKSNDVSLALRYLLDMLHPTALEITDVQAHRTQSGFSFSVYVHIEEEALHLATDTLAHLSQQMKTEITAATDDPHHIIHTDIDGNALIDGQPVEEWEPLAHGEHAATAFATTLREEREREIVMQDDESPTDMQVQTQSVPVKQQVRIVRKKVPDDDDEMAGIQQALQEPKPVLVERQVGPSVLSEEELEAILRGE